MSIALPVEVPYFEYLNGFDVDGNPLSKQVDFSELTFKGVFGLSYTSVSEVQIKFGYVSLAFSDITDLKRDYTVQLTPKDYPPHTCYGVVTNIDTDTHEVTVLLNIAAAAPGEPIYDNWDIQVVAGPNFGVAANAASSVIVSALAVPSVGDVISFTTGTDKLFDVGSTLLLTALSDSSNEPVTTPQYIELDVRYYDPSTGDLNGIVNKVVGSGTYNAWQVQRIAPVNYQQSKVGLEVTNPTATTLTITVGSILDSTGRVPLYNTATFSKYLHDLWGAGSGTTEAFGTLVSLAGTVDGTSGDSHVFGTGTAFDDALADASNSTIGGFAVEGISGGLIAINGINTPTDALTTFALPSSFTGKLYAAVPTECRTTLFIIRKDADGTVDFIEQIGTSDTLGYLPTGYTYYCPLARLTYFANQITVINSIPSLPVFGAAGITHNEGLVPDPGATTGAKRLLREDAIWANVGATATPAAIGTAAVGTADLYAREDHVHARGSSWLAVASGAFPAAATLNVAIPTGYSDIELSWTGVSSNTATRILQVQFSTDGGSTFDTTATNYPGVTLAGTAAAVGSASTASAIPVPSTMAAAASCSGSAVISGYATSGNKLIQSHCLTTTPYNVSFVGSYLASAAITHIRFLWSGSGNFDAGTYVVSVK